MERLVCSIYLRLQRKNLNLKHVSGIFLVTLYSGHTDLQITLTQRLEVIQLQVMNCCNSITFLSNE